MLGLLVSSVLMFTPPQAPAAGDAPAAPAPAAGKGAAPAPATPAAPATSPAPAAGKGAAPAPATPAAEPSNPFGSLIVFLPVVLLFYLMILRPQQQQEKKRKEMINTVERNARVLTSGGMYGTVVSIDKDANTVLLRLGNDPGVKVEFSRASIVQVLDSGDKPKKDAGLE